MTAAIATLLPALGAVAAAVLAYLFTKKREREAEFRKEKLEHYKAFVLSLTGIIVGESSPEGQKAFAKAFNNLLLFAPQPTIDALHEFREEITSRGTARSKERHDRLLSALFLEIRKDLGVRPRDAAETFRVFLQSSGIKPDGSEPDVSSK